jgi:hypothetical protein
MTKSRKTCSTYVRMSGDTGKKFQTIILLDRLPQEMNRTRNQPVFHNNCRLCKVIRNLVDSHSNPPIRSSR